MFYQCTCVSMNLALTLSIEHPGIGVSFSSPEMLTLQGLMKDLLSYGCLRPALAMQHIEFAQLTTALQYVASVQSMALGVSASTKKSSTNSSVPNKLFVSCAVKAVYRLEPLPAGTQRASLVENIEIFWMASKASAAPQRQPRQGMECRGRD